MSSIFPFSLLTATVTNVVNMVSNACVPDNELVQNKDTSNSNFSEVIANGKYLLNNCEEKSKILIIFLDMLVVEEAIVEEDVSSDLDDESYTLENNSDSDDGKNYAVKQCGEREKIIMIELSAKGKSNREIAATIHRSATTVNKVLNRYAKENSIERKPGSGRKRKTDARTDRLIVDQVLKNRFVTCKEIQELNSLQNLSWQTISRRIKEFDTFGSYWAASKPFISDKNKEHRLQWCEARKNWSKEQWRKVLWTDESPFVLRYNAKKRVWRRPGERYKPGCMTATVKHDVKIMVWGCFTAHGVGNLHLIDGIMDQHVYKGILENHLLPSAARLFPNGEWTFQQDNDPKHTAVLIRNWIVEKQLCLLEWPVQSPDLNPIENLWSIVDRQCKHRRPTTKVELFEIIKQAWQNIPQTLLEKLVDSMPDRCAAVIENKGWPTKY
jgi:transposase